MAQRKVTFCDVCDKSELEAGTILPTFFVNGGQELCHRCAVVKLNELYKVESTPAVNSQPDDDISPETKAFDARRQEIAEEQGVSIYVVKPQVEVEPGMVIEYGNPQSPRQVEIIEVVQGKPGEYFAKLVA